MDARKRRYRGFISYSQKDKAHARRIHRSLEQFRLPKGLSAAGVDPDTRRLGKFFRDDDEMGAASDLGSALRGAIEDAESLIVIGSPHAAKSPWVNEEVRHFKQSGRSGKIFAVIVDGEPNAAASSDPKRQVQECFPPALRFEVDERGEITSKQSEPLGIDLRKNSFAKVRARLAAGLVGVGFDDLWRRDRRRAQSRIVAILAAALVLTSAIGAAGYWSLTEVTTAQNSRSAAQAERDAAEQRRLEAQAAAEVAGQTAQAAQAETELVRVDVGASRNDALLQRTARALALVDTLTEVPYATRPQRAARDSEHAKVRLSAAALAYAVALTGDEGSAAPLLDRLGHLKVQTFRPAAGSSFMRLKMSPDWSRYVDTTFGVTGRVTDAAPREIQGAYRTFSPSGRWVAKSQISSSVETIEVRDVWSNQLRLSLPEEGLSFPSFGFSADERLLAIAASGRLQVWDLTAKRLLLDEEYTAPWKNRPASDSSEFTRDPVFSADHSRVHFVTRIGSDGPDRLWTYDLSAKRWFETFEPDGQTGYVFSGGPDSMQAMLPGPDPDTVIFEFLGGGEKDSSLKVLNVATGKIIRTIKPWGADACFATPTEFCPTSSDGLSPDRRYLVLTGNSRGRIYDLRGNASPMEFRPQVPCQRMAGEAKDSCLIHATPAVSPRAPVVAIGSLDGVVRLYDMASGRELRALDKASGGVGYVVFSPDGSRLVGAVATSDIGLVSFWIWDVATGRVVSRSGGIDVMLWGIERVDVRAQRLLSLRDNEGEIWESLGPVEGESVRNALKRVCALPAVKQLALSEEDQKVLPYGQTSEDVCTWQ